jgi:hypothetical protein
MIFVEVQWNDGEQGAIFDRTLAEAWKNSGSAWAVQGGSLTGITPGINYPAVASFQTQSGGRFVIANNDGSLPIQLVRFTAATIENTNNVRVAWTTLTETNNYGFFVQRSPGNESNYADLPNSFVPGHGTTLEPHSYEWVDLHVNSGSYYYRLKQIDLDGTIHYSDGASVEVLGPTSASEMNPLAFELTQNYPNPFNPSTTIEFSVESSSFTTLEVFNVLGQRIATLYSDFASPGQSYRVKFDGSGIANGMYFAKLVSGKQEALRTMILMK